MNNSQKMKTKNELFSGLLSSEELRQRYIDSGWLVSIPLSIVPAHWLFTGEQRLDGGFYSQDAVAAQRVINDSGFEFQDLQSLVAETYILGRFKRVYATDKNAGWQYLSASEAMDFRPTSNDWLAKDHAPKEWERHFTKQGWLLISSSGSVGRLVLGTKRLEKFFLTHDLIRVLPSMALPIGYLYAFLSTWIGQALLVKDQYGSAIKHLEPHHINGVPVPLIPKNEQELIHKSILHAYTLRDEANELLDRADKLLHQELGLPIFDNSLVPYLTASSIKNSTLPDLPHPKAFTINASELSNRLDSSYHVPIVREIYKLLNNGKYNPVLLSKLTQDIHLPGRFKRLYVKKDYGVPFLRPSHLPQTRPFDLGYISHLTPTLDSLKLHKGDVLITTDGTVGVISLVTNRTDNWAGSNNIARVTYGVLDNRNGYLAAFLMTPYGYHQLTREIYGGVVDHIESTQIAKILIPNAPIQLQQKIGKLVVDAFEKKDEASAIEEDTIQKLERRLEEATKTH